MLSGRSAYRGVLEGSISAVTGVAFVFLLFWALTGVTFFHVMTTALDRISAADMTQMSSYMMGLDKISPTHLQATAEQMKEVTKLAVPGTLIVFSMVIAYFNYLVISWILIKTGKKIVALPPFRFFALPKSAVVGFLVIYGLAYLTVSLGIIDKHLLMFNLEMIFSFVISVQGLAVVFFVGHRKRIPKVVLWIIVAIFVVTILGETMLFFIGLIDIILDIRKRFYQTNLKI